MNIRFEYLYRDAGNFKNWGEVILVNRHGHDVNALEQRARQVLIDQEYFDADKAMVPNLNFKDHIEALDHGWHEFHAFTSTVAETSDPEGRDIAEFIGHLEQASTI